MRGEGLRHSTSLAVMAALSLMRAGCSGYPIATPTATPTITPTATLTPAPACDADQVLHQVDELLAGETFEAHYLTINQELTLSVWLVDPEIDPSASQARLASNNRQALERGVSISYQIIDKLACVRQVFENINPMIVDRRYQSWYIDFVPIRAFPEIDNPTADDLIDALERSMEGSPSRRRAPPQQEDQPAPVDACGWPKARAAIQSHFGMERRNAAAYLLINDPPSTQGPWNSYATTNVIVQAQWDIHNADEADEAVILENLEPLVEALACLWPPVDLLEVFIVVPSGQMVIYGMVPGSLIRERVVPLPPEKVLLHYTLQDERP
jgi:hypothetical protein